MKIRTFGNQRHNISISQNSEIIQLSAKLNEQIWTYSTCFDTFNIMEDIIEITNDDETEVCIKRT